MYSIMAVKVEERVAKAPDLQEILTVHGCIIKTRVGLHETDAERCSMNGIIILHLYGEKEEQWSFWLPVADDKTLLMFNDLKTPIKAKIKASLYSIISFFGIWISVLVFAFIFSIR